MHSGSVSNRLGCIGSGCADWAEEVRPPYGRFGRFDPLAAMEKLPLALEIDQGNDGGRFLQLCQDRLGGEASDRISFDLVDQGSKKPVIDFFTKAQQSGPIGTPRLRPRRLHMPNATEPAAAFGTLLVDAAPFVGQVGTVHSGRLCIGTDLTGRDGKVNATGPTVGTSAFRRRGTTVVGRHRWFAGGCYGQDSQSVDRLELKRYPHQPRSQTGSCRPRNRSPDKRSDSPWSGSFPPLRIGHGSRHH